MIKLLQNLKFKFGGGASGGGGGAVDSVAGKTGVVTLQKSDITDFVEANYVHVTGNETVAGLKTFTSRLRCNVATGDVIQAGNLIAVTGAGGIGIHYGTPGVYGGGVTVASSGNVTIRQGSGAGCRIDLTTGNIALVGSDGGLAVLSTVSAAIGGIQVRNNATGAGMERVLTVSDMGLKWNAVPPFSPTDTGVQGQIAYDSSYFYICISTNSWIRFDRVIW